MFPLMDFYADVEQVPPDPIFGLNLAYNKDKRPSKVNLGAGIYKTTDLKSFILPAVKQAERLLIEEETSKDYLPIDGFKGYVEQTQKLVFGDVDERIYGAQVVGGTAALRLGGEFMRLHGYGQIFLSDPTWANHKRIFSHAGMDVGSYPYFDAKAKGFDFAGMCAALKKMRKGSVVLLQGCCHNPTGFDPSMEQWKEICSIVKERELFPFFDFAYQGFGKDPESDSAAIRLFVKAGLQCAVAVSHSKNFGLYAERSGVLFFVCDSADEARRVGARLKVVIRGMYSNPPCHGARLVQRILCDEVLKTQWLEELASMRVRITEMRRMLSACLKEGSDRFDFIEHQLGMFSYTGLMPGQVERLASEYGIYMPKDGRINVAGLNSENMHYVADATLSV